MTPKKNAQKSVTAHQVRSTDQKPVHVFTIQSLISCTVCVIRVYDKDT